MKKIVITGSLGFIGRELTSKLLERGDAVVGIDYTKISDASNDGNTNLYDFLNNLKYKHYEVDMRNRERMIEIFKQEIPDIVVHLGGRTGMKASFLEPEDFYSINVIGTESVLNACYLSNCNNVVFGSSVAVYGESFQPVSEDFDLPAPTNPYAASKLLGERLMQAYSETYGFNATVLRIFSTYGPGQRQETAVYQFTRAIDLGEPVMVYGDGTARRDYLYLDSCVDGIIKAMDKTLGFDIFNIGEQKTLTLHELISILSDCLGKKAIIEYIDSPKGIPGGTYANIEKSRKILGYKPSISIEEGMKRYVEWYRGKK